MLLDTHVLLWLLTDDERLGPRTRDRLTSAPVVHASAASSWQLAIKADLGRVTVPDELVSVVEDAGITWLSITPQHSWATREVTGLVHRDPFDRLLVAQAAVLRMDLVTADRALLAGPLKVGSDELAVVDARH